MTNISDSLIENIRNKTNIVDVISSYIPLNQKGKNFFGVCPFHNDHSPSMSVSSEKQIYKCFSCGASGNVFTFVSEYEGISFYEAVKQLANKVGIEIDINSKSVSKNEEYYEIMNLANKFYQNNLMTKDGTNAREYLKNRNITGDIIKEFNIGLSIQDNYMLTNLLNKKNINNNVLVKLGLTNKDGINYYDVFKNRIMFPLEDLNGNIVGFSGRIYDGSNTNKYLNTKETFLFKKGELLFNYHRAKNEIRLKNEVIIVEGFMDAIRVYQSGIKNVIALMGTSLTNDHINFIKKLRCKVILCLDNDNAGNDATYNVGKELTNNKIETFIIRLEHYKDPDEFIINNGIESFNKFIEKKESFNDFKFNYLKKNKNLNDSKDLAKYINDIIEDLNESDDDILKDITINKLNKEYNISLDVLKSKISKNNTKKEIIPVKKIIIENKKNKYDVASEKLLYYMMNDVKYIYLFDKEIGYFTKKMYKLIYSDIEVYFEKNKSIKLADFISFSFRNEYSYSYVLSIISNNESEELDISLFKKYLSIFKDFLNNEEVLELKNKMKNCSSDLEKVKIAEKIANIKKGCV